MTDSFIHSLSTLFSCRHVSRKNIVPQLQSLVPQIRTRPRNVPSLRHRPGLLRADWPRGAVMVSTLIMMTSLRARCVIPRKILSGHEALSQRSCICRCPSWMNTGGEHVSATSSCLEDGTWSSPEAAPKLRILTRQVEPKFSSLPPILWLRAVIRVYALTDEKQMLQEVHDNLPPPAEGEQRSSAWSSEVGGAAGGGRVCA